MEHRRTVAPVGTHATATRAASGKGAFPFRSGDRLPSRGEPDNAVSVPARELNIDAVSGRCAPAWCKNANMIKSGDYFVAVM
ncbi:hypothetical protein NUBL13779_37720 [Klebsiella pneumoniae]|nr:hypothetical protein NUBL13779_37720 [Klebsiella pneumoniae]GKP29631.1 hypothetical protein NUBL13780_35010 [Klebsiella pneumoniae]